MGMNLLFELYLSWLFQREKSKIQGASQTSTGKCAFLIFKNVFMANGYGQYGFTFLFFCNFYYQIIEYPI
ncbi:unnamed protein product [Larinioides sclopetarius]|uniref:Uncharacterized protein n=1 Tax=Larinioides sclopetarius TaxID=280406 RepID=A0AAV2BGK1_9ARAC